MVFKLPLIGDTGEETLQIPYSGLLGYRHLSVNMQVLLRRWSWNGHSSVTLGRTLHIHCSDYPGDRVLWVNMNVSLGKYLRNGHSSVTEDSAHSLFRSPGRQSSWGWWDWLRRWSGIGCLSVTLGKKLHTFMIQVSKYTELFKSWMPLVNDSEKETWPIHCLGSWDTILLNLVEFYSEEAPWNSHSSMTLGKKLCIFIIQVSQETDLFELVITQKVALKWHPSVTLGKKFCMFVIQVSQETKLFELVEYYSGDGFEMAIHQWH